MNVDRILDALNKQEVACILIGGMNFLLRHSPILTYDVDLWIEDTRQNLDRCEKALAQLDAQWGRAEEDWGPVSRKQPGWLAIQAVFCLTSPHGAIDIFRSVHGLGPWSKSRAEAAAEMTPGGVKYFALSDNDMLACQFALPETHRKQERIRVLQESIKGAQDG